MCGGGSPPPVKPLTEEEMREMTDNPFENPNSGVSAPSWKPEEVEAEIAAQEAAREKLKITDTAEVTPRASSGGGNKTKQQKANLAKNRAKAKSLATARRQSK